MSQSRVKQALVKLGGWKKGLGQKVAFVSQSRVKQALVKLVLALENLEQITFGRNPALSRP